MLAARLVSSLPRKPRAASSAAAALRSGSCRGPAPRCLAGAAGGDRTEATAQQLLYSIVESPGHRLDDHVERPERIAGVLKGLGEASFLGEGQLSSKVRELPATRQATSEEAGLIHSYAESLKKKAALSSPGVPVALADLGDPDGVTFATPSTYTDALHALGASLDLVDAVVEASEKGTPSPAFGIIRPPGHHATPSGPLGYCIFNNAAVAARYAQHAHGLKKIFILDYDVHNGNGTCEAFWEDSSVFVVDIHEESTVYPPEFIPAGAEDIGKWAAVHALDGQETLSCVFLTLSFVIYVGAGEGEGFTMNVPLPSKPCLLNFCS